MSDNRVKKFIIIAMLCIGIYADVAACDSVPDRICIPAVPEISADVAAPVVPDVLDIDSIPPSQRKKNIIDRIIGYFNESNKEHKEKAFDISFVGGPYYSSETKFGIGIVAAAEYKTDRTDPALMRSNLSLYGDISSVGFYMGGVRGLHVAPKDRYRIDYEFFVSSFKTKFWGIGYQMGNNPANESSYREFEIYFNSAFMYRLANHFYAGPAVYFYQMEGHNPTNPALWNGQKLRTTNGGVGVSLSYDTRDIVTAPTHGWNLRLDQRFFPRKISNGYSFISTELTAAFYASLWKTGVIATQLHSYLTYGDTPWGLMATVGGSNLMRGYYEGRYRDKSEFDFTVEIRQKVWRRSGIAVWGGIGSVFPSFKEISMHHLLPNWGVGYRWELKRGMNVRLDAGFGKSGQWGFVFNINEAF